MKKLWMRAGVSLELTDDEVQGILGTDNSGAEDIVKAALLDGRFSFDGDSYIPDVTVDEFVREHGLPYDPHQEVNFDFSPFGGFTIRKEDPPAEMPRRASALYVVVLSNMAKGSRSMKVLYTSGHV